VHRNVHDVQSPHQARTGLGGDPDAPFQRLSFTPHKFAITLKKFLQNTDAIVL